MALNLKELEDEAIEVNRRYNDYILLRSQHREKIINIIENLDNGDPVREFAKILMITSSREE